ncbi:GNAT family N-acetyltransferase [Prescottella soli]|uniref:GNAT family N-acetyltransferase n=1 Tax=Prescottella soli TaxID=1543852 RepID=A0ABW9FT72_9NOCA
MTDVTIRQAEPDDDLTDLPAMQIAAGALFRELGMDLVADGRAPELSEFEAVRTRGNLIVAASREGAYVGFLRTCPLDGALHVEQVTVAPGSGRRGIGRQLMRAAEQLALRQGFTRMTLTTYRDVPFNGPSYEQLDWMALNDEDLTDGLATERRGEVAAGLDQWPRIAMGKSLR